MYTTWGEIRGCCGHAHRTFDAAIACIKRDDVGCASQGGYSDRHLRLIESRTELKNYDVRHGPGKRPSQ